MALVIVGLTTAAIAEVFGTGLHGHRVSDSVATALSLAESHIAAAGLTEPLAARQSEGMFAGRFRWRLNIAPYEDPQKNVGRGFAEPAAGGLRLYRVRVTVEWRDGLHQRHVELDTLRTGPAAP